VEGLLLDAVDHLGSLDAGHLVDGRENVDDVVKLTQLL
jgi:hypothetical protein